MVGKAINDDIIGSEAEDLCALLLDDEMENNHIFGDQSMSILLAASSDQMPRPNNSFQKSAWHGSCASFLGNNSELLNLSTDFHESVASCIYLELHKHAEAFMDEAGTTNLSDMHDNGISESRMYESKAEVKDRPKMTIKHRMIDEEYLDLLTVALNEARFISSKSMRDCCDHSPRKPERNEDTFNADVYDEDGTDAECRKIITMNPFETICITLNENMSVIEIPSEDVLPVFSDSADVMTGFKSVERDHSSRRNPTPPTNTVSSSSGFSSIFHSTRGHVSHKEDEAPKRPNRERSPPRH